MGDVRTFDFIGLQIESDDQQLRLAYNLGSASSVSAVFATHTRLDDAKWHTIDLILYQDLVSVFAHYAPKKEGSLPDRYSF